MLKLLRPGVLAALFVVSMMQSSARADDRINAIMAWCQAETNPPSNELDKVQKAPDGNLRGFRPGSVLYAEALKAAKAGGHDNELQAVRWILLCVAHDSGSYDHVANNNSAVIEYLRQH